MPERRPAPPNRPQGVRRNLFHHQLSRRPTTSSTSTSAETLRLDTDQNESDSSDIVIRDSNGEFEIGDPPMQSFDEGEGHGQDEDSKSPNSTGGDGRGGNYEGICDEICADDFGVEEERQRLSDAVKCHRDRNRAPSEPAELLEAVKASLRAKVTQLAEDNWMYEPEEEPTMR